jgi:nicotinate-nucleotide pyrophosphorylase (carboxylating)
VSAVTGQAPASHLGRFPVKPETRHALEATGLDTDDVLAVIQRAVVEDLGRAGDVTSAATVPSDARLVGRYVPRKPGVIAGLPVLAAIVDHCLGDAASLQLLARDGDDVAGDEPVAILDAPARGLLAIERVSLNMLGHLSGIATLTHAWVTAVSGTSTRIRDTRKTTPGLRELEKYAVRCGGGVNHRRGLGDAILIKDNHATAAGGPAAALRLVESAYPHSALPVQVEVDDLDQLADVLALGAREVLLDNFTDAALRSAVRLVRADYPGVVVEASGGLTLDRAEAAADTGVDYLAVGALTHSAQVLDIGLDTGVG